MSNTYSIQLLYIRFEKLCVLKRIDFYLLAVWSDGCRSHTNIHIESVRWIDAIQITHIFIVCVCVCARYIDLIMNQIYHETEKVKHNRNKYSKQCVYVELKCEWMSNWAWISELSKSYSVCCTLLVLYFEPHIQIHICILAQWYLMCPWKSVVYYLLLLLLLICILRQENKRLQFSTFYIDLRVEIIFNWLYKYDWLI